MAHHTPQSNLAARREHETAAAKALAGLAHSLMIDFLRGWNSATNINILMADQAVQQAYALDRSVALAHVAESKIREVRGDLQGEINALNEALKLDPDLADAYAHKANALILLGRAQEAPELLTKAIELSHGDGTRPVLLVHGTCTFSHEGERLRSRHLLAEKIRRCETHNVVQLGAFDQRLCPEGTVRRSASSGERISPEIRGRLAA